MRNIRENQQFMGTVSTNPPHYPCHDRFVFSDPLSEMPTLRDEVRRAILIYIDNIRHYLPVQGVKIIGQSLLPCHPQDCEIDVLIEVGGKTIYYTPGFGDDKMHSAYKDLSLIQNTPLPGNPHTLMFTVVNSPEKEGEKGYPDYDDVYDVENNVWVKHDGLKAVDMENAMKADVEKFLNDLSRRVAVIDLKVHNVTNNIADVEDLEKRFRAKQLPELKKQLESRLSQIESDVKTIIRRYERLNKQRAGEYKNADARKLSELAKRAELPDDVVYRLLERYCYVELSKKLNEILDEGPVTADTVVDLKKVFDNFLNKQAGMLGK